MAGSLKCNGWGLFDMHGNVWEWCWDRYDANGADRVSRGGSWFGTAQYSRSEFRHEDSPSFRSIFLGFRVLRSSVKQARE